jgi:hypothetical protein
MSEKAFFAGSIVMVGMYLFMEHILSYFATIRIPVAKNPVSIALLRVLPQLVPARCKDPITQGIGDRTEPVVSDIDGIKAAFHDFGRKRLQFVVSEIKRHVPS